ncbi:MarR family transcriptional regulator [Actinoplanes siamensis]|uniref:HTH marR-type domain-containing protein n=1 Tax=Actinoplanes siamensis TaxID=1223317 RepID=A0A919N5B9_9ACTN|nr:helix-turn-helix domain-containing protein [Actinoplanes siamensis]GIF04667.1 hypothetical protein Asi03nite_22050 [Actinoplanes siamensis]
MTTTATPAAVESITAALTSYPDGMTTRDLADATGLTVTVVSKTLATMEADGTARREPDPKGRKTADTWHPVTPADEATDAPADDATPAPADEAALPEAPVSAPPVAPRKPDLKVMIMAGVLGDHEDGITADAAIDESGLSVAMGEVILAAMEVAGAARRLPITPDGTELWVPGENTDLATVDPANAPTSIACPTCGHERKIRRVSALRRTTGVPARVTAEVNTDGAPKLAKGELERIVEAFHRDRGPAHELTPGAIAKEIGRSSGAIVNAQRKLTTRGVLIMTRVAPETYAVADNAPAPAADVRALMAPPVTTPAADDTDTDGAAGSDASDDVTGTDSADTTPAADAA